MRRQRFSAVNIALASTPTTLLLCAANTLPHDLQQQQDILYRVFV